MKMIINKRETGRRMMSKRIFFIVCFLTFITCIATTADAVVITSASDIPDPCVVDFSGITDEIINPPQQVGTAVGEDIVWSSSISFSVLTGLNYGLASNGQWTAAGRDGFVGGSDADAVMRFDFNDGPTRAVGAFLNYAPRDVIESISILDSTDTVLETYALSISTPGGINEGAFYGFLRETEDIHAFIVSGFTVCDDLTFSREGCSSCNNEAPVPEPASLLLLGLGSLGMMGLRKRFSSFKR